MNINNYEHTSSKGVDNYMQQEVTDDPLPTTIMHCTMSRGGGDDYYYSNQKKHTGHRSEGVWQMW